MSGIELPPGIEIDDPRPIAARAPYTFFLPHAEELAALEPGDEVRAIFRQMDYDAKYNAERMWVMIGHIEDGFVTGTLDNAPADMPLFKNGDPVRIPLTHLIATDFKEGKSPPSVPNRREYWERCLVDASVAEGRCHADYLYREKPDMAQEGDKDPDSGWRIRGTDEAIADDEVQKADPMYVALGVVLNSDDRWLHLIDSEIGRAFCWDPERDDYIELE